MSENKYNNLNKRIPKQKPILKENSVYLNQSPIRKNREKCAQRNLEAISSFQTLQSAHKKGKSVIDQTDFGGWDDSPTIIPIQNTRKSCSQQVQRNKLIPYVQKQRKFTPKKIMLKMSKIPSPMIEYPIQRRLDTLNNQLLMLQGMSEFFGNDRFNKVLHGMNSVVLSRRVKRGNRVLSSKSFM